jgi:hypothetical protein
MTEMIFDTCQRLEGHVWCSIVQDLIVERWQTIFFRALLIIINFFDFELHITKKSTVYIRFAEIVTVIWKRFFFGDLPNRL